MERTYLFIEIPPKKKATYSNPAHEIVKLGKIKLRLYMWTRNLTALSSVSAIQASAESGSGSRPSFLWQNRCKNVLYCSEKFWIKMPLKRKPKLQVKHPVLQRAQVLDSKFGSINQSNPDPTRIRNAGPRVLRTINTSLTKDSTGTSFVPSQLYTEGAASTFGHLWK